MNPFDCFKKIVCINLDRRTDRWAESQAEFKTLDIELERFPAISNWHGPTGCSLSHLAIMNRYSHLQNILIMEDDVTLKGSTDYLQAAFESLPAGWEIFYLGGIVFPDEINYRRVSDHLHIAKNVVCTHAIAFSQAGMNRMIREFGTQVACGSKCPIDEFCRSVMQPSGRSYILTPMIFDQRCSFSDTTNLPGEPHNLFSTTNNKFK